MADRKNPESGIGPEFIRVVYDEKGNPVAVKPADVSATSEFIPDKTAAVTRAIGLTNGNSPRPGVVPYVVEQWLTIISRNILALKAQVDQTQTNYNQVIAEIKNIKISEVKIPDFPKMPDIKIPEMPDMRPIYEGIDGANHRIDALTQRMEQKMELVSQQVGESKMMYRLLADQINTMSDIVGTIAREFAQQKTLSKDFYEVFSDKIRQVNSVMIDIFSNMKSVQSELDVLRTDSMQRFSFIDEKIAAANRQLSATSEKTEADLIVLNDVVSVMNERIAELCEKMDSLQQFKQDIVQAVAQNKLEKELMVEEIIARTSSQLKNFAAKKQRIEVKIKLKKRRLARKLRKIKAKRKIKRVKKARKIVRKIVKKRKIVRKVMRAKINKNLIMRKLRKSDIADFNSTLVVTERKAQKYGRAVFDVARKMNGNVVLIMQEKMSEEDGFEPVTYDAIDNSEAVFIVTNRKMRKNFAVKNAALKRRVFLVDKKLKFSEVKY